MTMDIATVSFRFLTLIEWSHGNVYLFICLKIAERYNLFIYLFEHKRFDTRM